MLYSQWGHAECITMQYSIHFTHAENGRPNILFCRISIFICPNLGYWHCNFDNQFAGQSTHCIRCTHFTLRCFIGNRVYYSLCLEKIVRFRVQCKYSIGKNARTLYRLSSYIAGVHKEPPSTISKRYFHHINFVHRTELHRETTHRAERIPSRSFKDHREAISMTYPVQNQRSHCHLYFHEYHYLLLFPYEVWREPVLELLH